MKISLSIPFLFLIVTSLTASSQTVPACDIHTAADHVAAGIYFDNADPSQFILIGNFEVAAGCYTDKVDFLASHIDSVDISDHYEIGIYCINGDCPRGERVLDTGYLSVPQFFSNCPSGDYATGCWKQFYIPYGLAQEEIHWTAGDVFLPAGHYAVGMGSDCSQRGGGCAAGWGEDNPGAEIFRFKIFTGRWPQATRCLGTAWDNGLPSSLCTIPPSNLSRGAPHMIDFHITRDIPPK